MIGINVVDQYRPDPTIFQYNRVLWCVAWNYPNIEACPVPVGIWRFLVDPQQAFGTQWVSKFLTHCEWAVFANEPDIEGLYPAWYITRYAEWTKAGGKAIEPAWHDEQNYKTDGVLYDAVSWHCYAENFANRESVLKRANGRIIFGTEYANPGHQRQDALDVVNITEQVYLFAWEWPYATPNNIYTLRGLALEKSGTMPSTGNVLLQAGHINIESNCNTGLRGETGAVRGSDGNAEREINAKVAARAASLLMDAGVGCEVVDANFNCSAQVASNYAAVVALHCQSNPPDQSGWDVGVGNPTQDGAAAQSSELMQRIAEQYEAATGLTRQTWCQNNPNVQEYYLFNALSKSTPFALIEMCNTDLDWDWQNTGDHSDRMAYGVANGVLAFLGKKALNIPADASVQPTPSSAKQDVLDSISDVSSAVSALQTALASLRDAVTKL